MAETHSPETLAGFRHGIPFQFATGFSQDEETLPAIRRRQNLRDSEFLHGIAASLAANLRFEFDISHLLQVYS